MAKTTKKIKERLEYFREQLRAESLSMGEIQELESLAEHIDSGDVELLEAAGVPEHPPTLVVEARFVVLNDEQEVIAGPYLTKQEAEKARLRIRLGQMLAESAKDVSFLAAVNDAVEPYLND